MDRRIAAAAAAGLALIVGTIPAVRAEHILPTHPTLQLDPANVEDAAFGSAIALPDLNGDGAQDLVVGASSWGGNAAGEGRIASFLHTDGAWDRVGARISHPTDQAGSSFGFALASAGDVDGDGFEDVVVGAPDWNAPLANDIGRAYLYRGREGGLRVTDWSPVGGAEAADRFGWSVAGAR